ncbi:hypothetical protein F2Q68_00034654 [Brassica cretica]|uniref:Uncharacterized protein n=1 Tax=Brassica cretica TaxID=69181 RepID=A0A8S9H380_BRACR|nr:hypothetical protein F2Q68_00034654 [Brassica cretica]
MFHERDLGIRVFSFDESTEISARFYRKFLRKDLFTKISFRKNAHADFYGDLQTLIPSLPILTPKVSPPALERDKIGAAPYDGCLRTLVEGIKPSVLRLGVKREDYELSSHARILAKRQILGSRIMVFDTIPRDVRDQCAGFRARPRSITTLGGAMTTSTYVFCIVFDLIPSRFKVRDMFSAYVTCMVGIEHLFGDNF